MATKTINKLSPGDAMKSLTAGKFLTIKKIDQGGALQARRLSSGGIQFYWRYTHAGKADRVAIGTYDPTAPPKSLEPSAKGFSISAAVEACRLKARSHLEHIEDGGYRELEARAKTERQQAATKLASDQERTLSKLLEAYADHLRASERSSVSVQPSHLEGRPAA